MKLSEIKGVRVFDVIADIIDPIANIAEDEEVKQLFKKETLPEGEKRDHYVLQRLRKAIPCFLKKHKADIIAILAAIEGEEIDDYAAQLSFEKLFIDCAGLIQDKAFFDFFLSLVSQMDGNFSG